MDRIEVNPVFTDMITKLGEIFEQLPKNGHTGSYYFNNRDMKKIREIIEGVVVEYGNTKKDYSSGIYSFPLLTKKSCENLLTIARKENYTPNEEEPEEAQIPEVLLQNIDEEMFYRMSLLFGVITAVLGQLLYQISPEVLHTVQFAKYTVDNTREGAWHIDRDSDVTLVLSLNDDHESLGTVIKPYGFGKEIFVPQLPAGHAMLFRGKNYMHKGLPVLAGERNILVFWSEI